MLPSGAWGKRKPRGRRPGWVRSDARGTMWARQEGLRHPHPHAVIRCPSSSSSSISCSGKGPPAAPAPFGPLGHCYFFLPSFPMAPTSCCPQLPPLAFRATSCRSPGSLCLVSLVGPEPPGPDPCALPGLWLSPVPPGLCAHSWLYFPLGHQLSFLPFGSLSFF